MKIILLGAPGSGKGTQAVKLVEKFGIPHISTGDIFRDNIKRGTPLGLKIKEIIDGGHLCPDNLTCELIKNRLNQKDCENGYLLDGFPRNIYQAEQLDTFCPPDKVVELDIELSKIERRITGRRSCPNCNGSFHIDFIGDTKVCPTCGGELVIRKDDNVETVRERLSVYTGQTAPLTDYYSKQNKLVKVDGDKPVDEVFDSIIEVISK